MLVLHPSYVRSDGHGPIFAAGAGGKVMFVIADRVRDTSFEVCVHFSFSFVYSFPFQDSRIDGITGDSDGFCGLRGLSMHCLFLCGLITLSVLG